MFQDVASEAAVIVTVPAADPIIGAHRERYDAAARVGVPAHATIVYPFKPVEVLTAHDVRVLENLCATTPPVELTLSRTAGFGADVLYLAPQDPDPLVALTRLVAGVFPDYPPYRGAHPDVVPHVTIGHGEPDALRAAEHDVRRSLPIHQRVCAVELWSGPPLDSGRGPWRRVSTFPLTGSAR